MIFYVIIPFFLAEILLNRKNRRITVRGGIISPMIVDMPGFDPSDCSCIVDPSICNYFAILISVNAT